MLIRIDRPKDWQVKLDLLEEYRWLILQRINRGNIIMRDYSRFLITIRWQREIDDSKKIISG